MTGETPLDGIAIVGMAGRFPDAPDLKAFWENLCASRESVKFFTDEELRSSGIEPAALPPNFVRARAILEDAALFDARFFGYTPREAEILDPQQRLFLETAWSAIEDAGYGEPSHAGLTGVFAGMANNTYVNHCLQTRPEIRETAGAFPVMISNEKDYLATRTAYKLDLKGPAININTACSTSLVAICQACQSLLTYQCDMALAGGVAVRFPQKNGSLYQEGGMTSADGHCRAFDAQATGMVSGEGVGVVVLKRYSEAMADGDTIRAVIRGFAVNNDGGHKAGYTAPSIQGQAEVIATAQAMAGVAPETITYVEAHGTATPLGDPIEIAGLTKAFRASTEARQYCAIGSVKTNIGHLDAAAGVAGLIKTVLAMEHQALPASLHYTSPNPQIDFASTPFYVNATLQPWAAAGVPRRAGVSSFGIGGTNAHVVLEQAPAIQVAASSSPHSPELLLLSARSPSALRTVRDQLRRWLEAHPEASLADVAHTLRVGRRAMPIRWAGMAEELASDQPGQGDISLFSGPVQEMARRWLQGESVAREVLSSPERRRIPLPTYPFERESFWIEPAFLAATSTAQAAPPATNGVVSIDRVFEDLVVLFQELSALEGEHLDPQATFTELGFDSLFLTQASLAIERRFGVTISFRQFQEDLADLQTLAVYLAGKVQTLPDRGTTKVPPAEVTAEGAPSCADGTCQSVAAPARAESLSDVALRHIQELTSAYVSRTGKSKEHAQEHRAHFADPRTAAGFRTRWKEMVYPIVVERSAGTRLWDLDGNEYLDLLLGFGVNFFGHSPSFVTEVIERQLRFGVEIGPQSPLAGKVAAQICRMTGAERATFCNTGSEAVLAALRIARTVTRRDKVVVFAGSYHGIFDEVLVRTPAVQGKGFTPVPVAPGILPGMVEHVMVLEYGSPEALEIIGKHAGELAAVLVEPVQSRNPDLQPQAFLHDLRQITAAAGTALIFDEIITGFRCHPGGAQAWFDVEADICTYGKVIGGGMPLGVVAGKARFMDALDGGAWRFGDDSAPTVGVTYFAGTFVRHPLALAAAHAVMAHLEKEGPALQSRLNDKASALAARLRELLHASRLPLQLGCFSSVLYLRVTQQDSLASLLFYHLRLRGLHLWEGRPFFLSTVHTDADVARVVRAFEESLAALAEVVPAAPPVAAWTPYTVIAMTEAQRDSWVSAQTSPDASRGYNLSYLVHLHGVLHDDAVERALRRLVARHEALRTSFDAEGAERRIWNRVPWELARVELAEEVGKDRPQALQAILQADADQVFVLEQAPLFRATLIRLGAEHHALLLTAHHLVMDGWSFGILLQEFAEIYSAIVQGRATNLPPALQPRSYSHLLETGRDAASSQILQYWLDLHTPPAPALQLPTDRPRPPVRTHRAATASFTLNAGDVADMRTQAAKQSATVFQWLVASITAFLHRLSGAEDWVLGIPAAGQATAEGLRIKGDRSLVDDRVNLLPLRLRCDSTKTFVEVLQAVKQQILAAYEHQNFTYGELVRRLNPPYQPGHPALVPMTFNLDRGILGLSMAGLTTEMVSPQKPYDFFDLRINATELKDTFRMDWTYNPDLFDAATIKHWLEQWSVMLQAFVSQAEVRLEQLWQGASAPVSAPVVALPGHRDFTAPRRQIEETIAACWREVLGVDAVSVHDSFFALGGHSLKVLKLLLKVKEQTGVALRVRDFFGDPTVAGMARLVDPESPAAAMPPTPEGFLLRLREGTDVPPLFILPGGWGGENEALVFATLLPGIAANRSVYAVLSRCLEDKWEQSPTLRGHAEALLTEIRKVQPHGPYHLLGECNAVAMAMELVNLLETQGEPPGRLIFLDRPAPTPPTSAWSRWLPWRRGVNGAAGGDEWGPREGTLPDRVEHYHQLLDSWTPRPVTSEIHLVLSTGFKDPEAVASGWKWLALGGLHLHAVSGNHHTYIRDDSAPTVKVLNQLI
ncbi:aminotransferase class III-fold pyridoxal phosphate-dependent enzyme [Verrucomicrobium sp. BvORR106]|uniref:aminotransferase class III-fold pyridoxal phosphate-dependent enzyme n=1 Tax=Verrucomicrobium sp. BvORR106 TaxID=1403819 RepID=UPI00068BFC9A|nr:aminotransferase class III-fold pyridoxal phosphate-dependent enzyme [Verrucomicrobium sp. BvORR106]